MSELKRTIYEIVDELFDANVNDDEWGEEEINFLYITNGYNEVAEWRGTQIYHEDDDRGWNYEKNDYERTIKEQIIYNLTRLRNNLNDILAVIDKEEN
jgi:hypothetical protein